MGDRVIREGEYIEGEGGELSPKALVRALVSRILRSSFVRGRLLVELLSLT